MSQISFVNKTYRDSVPPNLWTNTSSSAQLMALKRFPRINIYRKKNNSDLVHRCSSISLCAGSIQDYHLVVLLLQTHLGGIKDSHDGEPFQSASFPAAVLYTRLSC